MLGHLWNNVSVDQLKPGFFQNAEFEKLPSFATSPFFALCFGYLRDHIKCPPGKIGAKTWALRLGR